MAFKIVNQTVIDVDGTGATQIQSAAGKDISLYPDQNIWIKEGTKLIFEGTLPDAFEAKLQATTLTADRDLILPDGDGTLATEAYVTSAVTGGSLVNTDGLAEGPTNLYYTTTRANTDFDTRLATKSTTDLTEGTNLYYTDARADARITNALGGNVTIGGDLIVSGTTTTVNSTVVEIADSIITLNSDETGTPSQNGGIEIERGTSTNVQLRFNETSDQWEFTNDGSTYVALGTSSTFSGTTDGVNEGSTNLYYTNARARTEIEGADLDLGTNKILYSNVYATTGDLPTASSYHGMFAHVHAEGKGYFAHAGAWKELVDTSSSTGVDIQFNSIGAGTAASGAVGDIRATADVTAYYSSDASLKENVINIENALDKVKQIRGVEFDWTADYIETKGGEDGYFVRKHDVGVIAQEVEAVLPEVVGTRDDGIKAVRYDRIVALLIEAIKEQQTQIDELNQRLNQY